MYPLFIFGRVSRSNNSLKDLVTLAKRYNAKMLTGLKQSDSFPTRHHLHSCPRMCSCLIISRDWVYLVGTLKASHEPGTESMTTVIHISLDSSLHKGRSKNHFGLPPADIFVCRSRSDCQCCSCNDREQAASQQAKLTSLPTDSRTAGVSS